ncbi:MAG: cysteine--tRNA ligase [Puniceicoccales bacterium]|nr:cysteine--tRNA ligase [Puniceicoccales bacterium]
MQLRLYDTLTRTIRPIEPVAGRVGTYCCGPTVYGPAHIGNFRTYVVQDVVVRTLQALGIQTCYVRNLTDVDDKTIRGAQQAKQSLQAFTSHWTEVFEEDCRRLNLLQPDIEPRATETIQAQLDLIGQLMQKGCAYVSKGSVYFRISSFKDYGKLSHLDQRCCKMQGTNSAGELNNADEYERECVGDFVLWKNRKPEDGDVYWESPWGQGRPGWHIECSAMSCLYLGETVDLHVGGVDLCFPHHENEIAQSEAAYGGIFARHWMHIAHLKVDGEKMSKSLGNLHTVASLLQKNYSREAIRYALMAGHYRHPLNFTFDLLNASQSALQKLYQYLSRLLETAQLTVETFEQEYLLASTLDKVEYLKGFFESLCDDLNVPKALGQLFTFVNDVNIQSLDTKQILHELGICMFVLGLPVRLSTDNVVIPLPVRRMAEQRWQAKQACNYQEADDIRHILLKEGWQVLDTQDGYKIVPLKNYKK